MRWNGYHLLRCMTSLLICCSLLSACSRFSIKITRKELLQEALQTFHMALITQNIPSILRHFPAENRGDWDKPFRCLFKKVRFDDYAIQMVRADGDMKEAAVFSAITGHRLNSLITHAFSVKEQWIYIGQGWYIDLEPTEFEEIFEECLPDSQNR